jgi:hypothetical protein
VPALIVVPTPAADQSQQVSTMAQCSTKSKPADPSGHADPNAERIAVTLHIVFNSDIRQFGYYDAAKQSPDDILYEYPTAHDATDAALVHGDEMRGDGQRLASNVDLTIEGGDWDEHLPPNTTVEAGPAFRNWFSSHLYELTEDELRKQVADDIEVAKAAYNSAAGRHDLPLGQAVEAAIHLHKKLYPDRTPRSNTPTQTQFLDVMFGGIDRRTRDRNYKAFLIVASQDWPTMDAGYAGPKVGLERIFAAAEQFGGRPPRPPRTPLKTRYQTLRDAFLNDDRNAGLEAIKQYEQEDTHRQRRA